MLARSRYHKIPTSSNGTTVDGYLVGIVNTSDYSPFGVQLDGRTVSDGRYRFGFNDMEMDNEVSGNGNSINYKYRMHCLSREERIGNPRIGRWLSIDPKRTAWESPYVSMGNNPILYNDVLGDSVEIVFNENFSEDMLKMFMATSHGKKFIGRFAAAGQTIAGHTFEVSGDLNDDGFDLNLADFDYGTWNQGTTNKRNSSVKDPVTGRKIFNVNINSNMTVNPIFQDYDKALKDPDFNKTSWEFKQMYNLLVAEKIKTLTHELFIHVELGINDLNDDGSINQSNIGGVQDNTYIYNAIFVNNDVNYSLDEDGSYKPVIININSSNLYLYEGWYVVKSVHKWLGTGKTNDEIWKSFLNGISDED